MWTKTTEGRRDHPRMTRIVEIIHVPYMVALDLASVEELHHPDPDLDLEFSDRARGSVAVPPRPAGRPDVASSTRARADIMQVPSAIGVVQLLLLLMSR